jgi:hypothetical protein
MHVFLDLGNNRSSNKAVDDGIDYFDDSEDFAVERAASPNSPPAFVTAWPKQISSEEVPERSGHARWRLVC